MLLNNFIIRIAYHPLFTVIKRNWLMVLIILINMNINERNSINFNVVDLCRHHTMNICIYIYLKIMKKELCKSKCKMPGAYTGTNGKIFHNDVEILKSDLLIA